MERILNIVPGQHFFYHYHVEGSLAHIVGDNARERSKAGYTEAIYFIMSNSDCVFSNRD